MPIKEYLEIEETQLLEDTADNLRDKLLVRLPRRLGCRISEVLGLDIDHIDFDRQQVIIEHLKARIKLACPSCGARLGKSSIFCSKCGTRVEKAVAQEKEFRRQRRLPVDRETLDMLQDYIDRGGPKEIKDRQILFPITRGRVWQIYLELAEKAGLPNLVNMETGRTHHVTPHKMRDSFAIHAVKHNDSGDGLRLLQEQLGHQDIGTTMRYRKVAGEELRDWYDDMWGEKK
jgi:integrase/recombinase XerD